MRALKKSLMVLLVCCLAVFVLPALSTEVSAETQGDWTYTVSNGVATVTGYSGKEAVVTVPESFGYYQVTAIGEKAFADNATMTKVVLPKGLTNIGKYALSGPFSWPLLLGFRVLVFTFIYNYS